MRSLHRANKTWQLTLLGLASILLLHSACSSTLDEDERLARQEIARVYPGWEPVTAKDLSEEDHSAFLSKHPEEEPGFASGDYFGDGRKAWSALLTKVDERGKVVRLVVLGMTPSGRFESYAIFTEAPVEEMPTIFTSKAGAYQVYLDDQVVPVPHEGVVYVHPGESAKLFFWNRGVFVDVEVSPDY